ncbi:hypothetical protein ACN28G_29680 [Micromonospora sp. WMMA1923]|uniref:hypothetical protein n=1 Tax=Micromonospora sp. WMMA1923 TaxID=3404125 RepID=UPI003B93ABA0
MTTYLSATVAQQLRAAQARLDRHTPSSADGRCSGCAEVGPCPQRRAALRVFGRYGRLPRRWPGATRPERINRASSWSWLRPQ